MQMIVPGIANMLATPLSLRGQALLTCDLWLLSLLRVCFAQHLHLSAGGAERYTSADSGT
jgi:hypothetical protein